MHQGDSPLVQESSAPAPASPLPAALTSLSHLTPALRARLETRSRLRRGPGLQVSAPARGAHGSPGETRDASTITDVCGSEHLPEVEIFSLLEEQIPRYKLRADALTEFAGYENQDWFIPSPALPPSDAHTKLSPDQIRETLNYFVLCSNRVSQMTKTYNDIEAVTRLLEEKEKDLELTARIGKELLAHNGKLEARVTELETELRTSQDSLAQLTHELAAKTELVRVLTNDTDTDTGSENGTPTGLRCINVELMHRKVSELEEENKLLRNETMRLVQDTDHCEEEEARLIKDFTSQLSNANLEVDSLHDELDRLKEENRLQNDRIQYLTEKLNEAEMRLHKFTLENEEVSTLLSITKENQCSLASELAEFKERYAEVMGLLREAQEQLRKQRKRGMPAVRGCGLMPSLVNANGGGQPDSLQSELESSLYSELSLDSGISGTGITPTFKKVFDTVQSASRTSMGGTDVTNTQLFPRLGANELTTMTSVSSVMSSNSQPRLSSYQYSNRSSMYSNSTGIGYLDSTGQSDSEEGYPGAPQQGMPGVPGAADLEAALRRLTPAEVMTRRAMLSSGPVYGGFDYDRMPLGCRTPDSIMSTGSSGVSGLTGRSSGGWKLPEKLQIVKPLEGSQTLHHWSQLATPTLSGLLEERPGVKIRGGRGLEELGMELHTLSDLEEDDEVVHPGKRFQNSGCVYTYTNSTVLHPDDGTSVTHSTLGSQICSGRSSHQATAPPTPGMQTPMNRLSRRNSCSTFSTNMGLASMLNERGIQAATPSCFNTPGSVQGAGPHQQQGASSNNQAFTPTATPCNSPDGSPTATPRSMSPGPQPGITGLLSQGADMLWRAFASGSVTNEVAKPLGSARRSRRDHLVLSRSEKKALTNIRIMEKVERMGLENIMLSPTGPVSANMPMHGGAIITRRNVTSPMAQLTSLKGTLSTSSSSDRLSTTSSEGSTSKSIDSMTFGDENKSPLPPATSGTVKSSANSSPRSDARQQQMQSRQRQRRMTRPDLGTVVNNSRPDLGTVTAKQFGPAAASPEKTHSPQSTFGTISSLFFGRKGGLL